MYNRGVLSEVMFRKLFKNGILLFSFLFVCVFFSKEAFADTENIWKIPTINNEKYYDLIDENIQEELDYISKIASNDSKRIYVIPIVVQNEEEITNQKLIRDGVDNARAYLNLSTKNDYLFVSEIIYKDKIVNYGFIFETNISFYNSLKKTGDNFNKLLEHNKLSRNSENLEEEDNLNIILLKSTYGFASMNNLFEIKESSIVLKYFSNEYFEAYKEQKAIESRKELTIAISILALTSILIFFILLISFWVRKVDYKHLVRENPYAQEFLNTILRLENYDDLGLLHPKRISREGKLSKKLEKNIKLFNLYLENISEEERESLIQSLAKLDIIFDNKLIKKEFLKNKEESKEKMELLEPINKFKIFVQYYPQFTLDMNSYTESIVAKDKLNFILKNKPTENNQNESINNRYKIWFKKNHVPSTMWDLFKNIFESE